MNGSQGVRTVPLLGPRPLVWEPRPATSDPRTGAFPNCRLEAEAELALEAPSWLSGLWSLGTNKGTSAGSPHLGTVRFSEIHRLPETKEFTAPPPPRPPPSPSRQLPPFLLLPLKLCSEVKHVPRTKERKKEDSGELG